MNSRLKACGIFESDTDDERRRQAKWAKAPFELGFNSGPFHNMIRSSGYGELYDEIPWKVMLGADSYKDRHGYDRNTCRYRTGVLIHNWLEEGRDRQLIKFSRTAPISTYAHIYRTTYGNSIGKKWVCDKQSPMLRTISEFPKNSYPGHQPELDVDKLRCCLPTPTQCTDRQQFEACFEEKARQKRVAMSTPSSSVGPKQ